MRSLAPALLLLLAATAALAQDSSIDDAEKARVLAKALAGALPNTAKFGYGGCCTTTPDNRKGIVSPPKPFTAAAAAAEPPATGVLKLGLSSGSGRDGYVFIPSTYTPATPAPLIVALHGANKTAFNGMATVVDAATAAGAIVIAPSSRDPVTWDMFGAGFGADVAYINASIAQVSDLYNIDPARVAVQGFSDGATYALSLGLASGKAFTHVIAFSPGGVAPPQLSGTPQVFISAGQKDTVFPFAAMTAVACQLVSNGYPVTFESFPGGHEVPVNIAAGAVTWMTGEPTQGNMPAGACSA